MAKIHRRAKEMLSFKTRTEVDVFASFFVNTLLFSVILDESWTKTASIKEFNYQLPSALQSMFYGIFEQSYFLSQQTVANMTILQTSFLRSIP
jgi:hypothetical protein